MGSGAAGDPLATGEPDAAGDPDAAGEPEASGELDAEGEPDAAGEPLGCGADTREIAHVPLMNSTDVPEVSTTASAPVPLLPPVPPPPVVGGSVADGEPSAPLVVLLALGVALAIGGSVVTLVPLVGDEFAVGPQAATAKAAAVAPMNKSLFPPTGASFLVIGRALNHTAQRKPPAGATVNRPSATAPGSTARTGSQAYDELMHVHYRVCCCRADGSPVAATYQWGDSERRPLSTRLKHAQTR